MKFIDPVSRVRADIFAHRLFVFPVVIDRLSPIRSVAICEIPLGELSEVITVRPKWLYTTSRMTPIPSMWARSTNRLKSSGDPYKRDGAKRFTPSYPQPNSPG